MKPNDAASPDGDGGDNQTVADFIATEIPRTGDTTRRGGLVIRNMGRYGWDGKRLPDRTEAPDQPDQTEEQW